MQFIPKNRDFDLIGLGEVMLRLSPSDSEKISQSETFVKNAGGSELNVASGAAQLGLRSAIVTKIPENKIGHFIRNKIRYGNVSDDYIVYDSAPLARLGIYYYEAGAYPRKSSVIYDRTASSMTTLRIQEIPDSIYDKAGIFHISSISLALDPHLRETAIEMVKRFRATGTAISFDVNYRAALWDEDTARGVVTALLPMVDILFVSEETSRRMFRRTGALEDIMKGYCKDFGCKVVATTMRTVISPKIHNFTSKLYYDGTFYEEKPYEGIEVVDRVGSGDAYLAGTLFGLVRYNDPQRALETGNAMSAMKNTISGDMPACSPQEIESIIRSHHSTGHQDEMNR